MKEQGKSSTNFDIFMQKRKEWIEYLTGDDRNSIRSQVLSMLWYAAVYRIINEARRIAPQDKEERVQLNEMVHGLVNYCFFESQAVERIKKGDITHYRQSIDRVAQVVFDLGARFSGILCLLKNGCIRTASGRLRRRRLWASYLIRIRPTPTCLNNSFRVLRELRGKKKTD